MFIKNEQGLAEFCNEVVLITGMRHRNLVKLKGCCLHETQRFLVYEYVENYDLQQALLGKVPSSCTEFIIFILILCSFFFILVYWFDIRVIHRRKMCWIYELAHPIQYMSRDCTRPPLFTCPCRAKANSSGHQSK